MESRPAGNGGLRRADRDGGVQVSSESVTAVRAVAAASSDGTVKFDNIAGVIQGESAETQLIVSYYILILTGTCC